MAKIPSISWLSSHVPIMERMEPRRPSLPMGDTHFSIARSGMMLWGPCKRMRMRMGMGMGMGMRMKMRMRMRMRVRRNN